MTTKMYIISMIFVKEQLNIVKVFMQIIVIPVMKYHLPAGSHIDLTLYNIIEYYLISTMVHDVVFMFKENLIIKRVGTFQGNSHTFQFGLNKYKSRIMVIHLLILGITIIL